MNHRHFSVLSKDEVWKMTVACQDAAAAYAKSVNMSGLSHLGCHNIYTMLENGFLEEWNKSRVSMGLSPDNSD
jgi:hypothetical protein